MSQASTRRLGDLCELISVQVDPAVTPNAAYIGLEHVPSGRFWTPRHGLAREAQSSKFEFAEGDLLYGKLRPYLDKAVIARHAGVCTTELLVLRPRPDVSSTYLAAVVHAPGFTEHAMSGVTGAHHPRTSWRHITEFQLPAHDHDQRQQIGNLLTQIQRLIECVEIQATTAREIKSRAMDSLFSRGMRGEPQREPQLGLIPASWAVKPLGELGRIGNGTTPNRQHLPYWADGKVPWITSGRMYERRISSGEVCVTTAAITECSLPRLAPGAVLIAIVGQGKTLGHCALLEVEATVSRHVGFIQPKQEIVRSDYLIGYLEYRYDALRQLAAGNGSTRAALTCAMLRGVQVPVPALDEQGEIARVLDVLNARIELHEQKLRVLEKLFKALLHKLMTGEIDVNDLDLSALQPAT